MRLRSKANDIFVVRFIKRSGIKRYKVHKMTTNLLSRWSLAANMRKNWFKTGTAHVLFTKRSSHSIDYNKK